MINGVTRREEIHSPPTPSSLSREVEIQGLVRRLAYIYSVVDRYVHTCVYTALAMSLRVPYDIFFTGPSDDPRHNCIMIGFLDDTNHRPFYLHFETPDIATSETATTVSTRPKKHWSTRYSADSVIPCPRYTGTTGVPSRRLNGPRGTTWAWPRSAVTGSPWPASFSWGQITSMGF